MNMPNLRSRLDHLDEHIQTAESHLNGKDIFSAEHKVKAAELRARYEALSRKLEAEVADAEAQGAHVSDLDRSVRQWLDSLEMRVG